ncbi:MAG: hypothetical protein HC897_12800 [Thermoanaerobaculia bacterium]|nr:hypothetical protein [Thermoanaerobaculia bacterium]
MPTTGLRSLRWWLVAILVFYFFAGGASQKLVPGVDEIFPFFGWSLFSKVPVYADTYTLWVDQHRGRAVEPPVDLLHAPDTIVTGNRYIARKVIQKLGRACDRGETAEIVRLRQLLEQNYLRGKVRYEIRFERYQPLDKWRTGASLEQRSLGSFQSGAFE